MEGSPIFQVTEKIKATRMMLTNWACSNVRTRSREIREAKDKFTSLLGHPFTVEFIEQKKSLIGRLNFCLNKRNYFGAKGRRRIESGSMIATLCTSTRKLIEDKS